ncbi:MAG: hypothetical protein M3433_01755 [Actinomycetota bacterium]|nr:hypothetical protein [Actinomycetota bacterium]
MDRTESEPRARDPWSGRQPSNGPDEPPAYAPEPPPGQEQPPGQAPPPPPPPPPPGGHIDFSPFFVLLDGLRRAVPADMQNQFTRLVRETLVTLRGLIDWYLDRLDRPEPEQRVEDIPID